MMPEFYWPANNAEGEDPRLETMHPSLYHYYKLGQEEQLRRSQQAYFHFLSLYPMMYYPSLGMPPMAPPFLPPIMPPIMPPLPRHLAPPLTRPEPPRSQPPSPPPSQTLPPLPTTSANAKPSSNKPAFSVSELSCETKQQLPADFQPGYYDVICGRGKGFYGLPSNVRFRDLVAQHAEKYMAAKTKVDKSCVLMEIVQIVRSLDDGRAKFIKKDSDGSWVEISEDLAREKVGHAMREIVQSSRQNAENPSPKIKKIPKKR